MEVMIKEPTDENPIIERDVEREGPIERVMREGGANLFRQVRAKQTFLDRFETRIF